MSKSMYCPMSFRDFKIRDGKMLTYKPEECTPDCALVVKDHGNYGCAITYLAAAFCAEAIKEGFSMNTRPLKDDAE